MAAAKIVKLKSRWQTKLTDANQSVSQLAGSENWQLDRLTDRQSEKLASRQAAKFGFQCQGKTK